MNSRHSLVALLTLLLAGCGPAGREFSSIEVGHSDASEFAVIAQDAAHNVPRGVLVSMQGEAIQPAGSKRKIIYDGNVALEMSDIDVFSQQLDAKLIELGGFVANFKERRYAGDRRSGTWILRLDASAFGVLLSWLDEQYNVTRKDVTSQDVTEEFVDLTARVANKKHTEQRLVKLLEERPGKLEEVLAVEREIDRVREEIERIEGRLRFLAERVALSTITLTADTRVDYEAPQQAGFATRVGETWTASVTSLSKTGQSIAIGAVGIAPWLPVLLAMFAVAYLALRLLFKLKMRLTTAFTKPLDSFVRPNVS